MDEEQGRMSIRMPILATIAVLIAALVLPSAPGDAQVSENVDFRVTVLGSGSPLPSVTRFGPSIMVQAGKETLLFDAGRGVSQRMWQARVPLNRMDALFITHLHSDHIVGIPDLWLTGWLIGDYGRRSTPFRVWGPAGTRELMDGIQAAYRRDIEMRTADQKLPKDGIAVEVTEFKEGVIYDRNGVKVTAIEVDHGPIITPAFGFRVDYDGRSVVISGDTRGSDNLVRHAKGTDLLLHNVVTARDGLIEKSPAVKNVLSRLAAPEDAGNVFTRAAPRLAAFYHFVFQSSPEFPPVTEQEIIDTTRRTYAGPLVLSEDLMAFVITREGVRVVQPPARLP